MAGEVISERRATSNRNGGRDYPGTLGDFRRNPHNTAESGALAIAERARRAVRSLEIEHLPTPEKIVTISLGVASVVPANGPDDAGGLVKAADKALYASKMRGRDRVSSMTPPADATVVD
jgi:GGDEF domain-containing protein